MRTTRLSLFRNKGLLVLMAFLVTWLVCLGSVFVADRAGGIGILSSGTGGGPIAGSVHVTVIKAGSDTGGAQPVPIPGAFVMVGLHEGEPFQGNYGFTNAYGEITFMDPALVGPQVVTAGANGYEFYTFADVNASDITIPLKEKNVVVPTSQVTGSLSNFPGVNCDNIMQMALVIPPVKVESLLAFDLAGQLTENVPVDIAGEIVYLPGNLVIPTQKENPVLPGLCWLLGVNISKPSYLLYLPTGTTQHIFSFGLQADIDDLLSGNLDISTMTPLKVGITRDVVISGTMTVNINMTHTLTSNLTLAVANAPSGSNVLLASLGEINGNPAYAPGVGDVLLLGFGQIPGGAPAAAVLATAAKTSPFNDLRYLAAAIASFPEGSGLTGATGLLDRSNYTPPVTRSLYTFFSPVQVFPVVGNYLSFSNAYQPGISPLPDLNFSRISLVTTVPDTRPGAEPGATMDVAETLWTIASPGEDLAVYIPVLPSVAPPLPLFPDQTPDQDRLVWNQTVIALTLDPTFNFDNFSLDVIARALTHFSSNSREFSYCQDRDGDGYGNPASSACGQAQTDCLDDPSGDAPVCATCSCGTLQCASCARCVHPGAPEVCDGIDNNCSGQIDEEPSASASCQNESPCDGLEYCSAGSCHSGTPLDCDDGNVCTDDSCDPVVGCVHTNNSVSCNDNNVCTVNDYCSGGICVGGGLLNCDDGNACTDDSCNPLTGCVYTNNTAPCDDGNVCTTNDQCSAGVCVGGAPLPCDDGNVCTDDSCDPVSGCVYSNNAAPCDDGNVCTTNDQCSAGVCLGGEPLDCDDGNICTNDGCNPSTGCSHVCNAIGAEDPCCTDPVCSTEPVCAGIVCIDNDSDGYGNPASPACPHPELDCDDADPNINPGSPEGPPGAASCYDRRDNDCDGYIDSADSGCSTMCVDRDGDGFGNPASSACEHPGLDCNDDPSGDPPVCATCTCGVAECAPCARCINPRAKEFSGDGIDSNCNNQENCFIATAAFGTPVHGKIDLLRSFRSSYLMMHSLGTEFVAAYYTYSPPIAEVIARHAWLRAIVRTLLLPLIGVVSLIT